MTSLAVALVGLSLSPAAAQAGKQDPPKEAPKQEAPKTDAPKTDAPKAAEPPKVEAPKPDPKIAEYEKAIKDLVKVEGPFTFYQRKKDILLELPESRLGQLFYLQAALNTGIGSGAQAGFPVGMFNVDVFRFDRKDDRVWLVKPRTNFRWNDTTELKVSAERSFPEAYLADYRIEQSHPEKKLLLINIGALFQGELFKLSDLINQGGGGSYTLDREKTGVDRIKGFPENSVLRMAMYYDRQRGASNPLADLIAQLMGGGGNGLEDSRSLPIKVTYNMWYRKPSDYQPRLSDPRIGYFTQDYFDLDRYYEIDRNVRMINRFNLKKKDPKAALSEPVQPIVWYIDSSVPEKYRDAARAGILSWNKAFEAIGYKNAVVVKDAPNDPDWDHADGRFNVYRWVTSPALDGAIALFRTDPFTGEILNASVNVDATFVYGAELDYDRLTSADPAYTARAARSVLLRRAPDDHDDHAGHSHASPASIGTGEQRLDFFTNPGEMTRREALVAFKSQGWQEIGCSYASDMAQVMARAAASLEARGLGIKKDDLIRQCITEVTAHELGHCMGLRHNFVASTYLSLAELSNPAIVNRDGITASVMEYNDVNVAAMLKGNGQFFSGVVGPYDVHAIKYGYMETPATKPADERPFLNQVARLSGVRGLEFMTDEDADQWNPYVVRFDGGRDTLNYIGASIDLLTRVRKGAIARQKFGESTWRRNRTVLSSFRQLFAQGQSAAMFIGGLRANRTFYGDIDAKPNLVPVPDAEQRQAMHLIAQRVLSVNAVDVPDSVLQNMAGNFEPGNGTSTVPLRSTLANGQISLVASLLNADKIEFITENAFKRREVAGSYTLAEHYGLVVGRAFEEIGTPKPITSVRRDVHRFALQALLDQAGAPAGMINEDARAIANDVVRRLDVRIAKALRQPSPNALTTAHLKDMHENIGRFLNRSRVDGDFGGGGGGGGFDLSSLFGRTPRGK